MKSLSSLDPSANLPPSPFSSLARYRRAWRSALISGCIAGCFAAAAGGVRADAFQDFNRAVAAGDSATLSRLLARGMDPNTVNDKGEAALLATARDGTPAMAKALLQARANINIRSPHGDSPIMLAALAGNLPMVKLLRESGAEINHPGWTPLQYAANGGHNAVIDYLISTGADLALTAPNGATPVMLAVSSNKSETVRLLVRYGFDLDARNDKRETALAWAVKRGYGEVEQILRQAGAKQ